MSRHVDYNRVKAEGIVNYVSEMFIYASASEGRWPMTNFEANKGGDIPEGSRLRIKASVNVAAKLATDTDASYYGNEASRTATQQAAYDEALAIAKGLQKYGIIVGDNSTTSSRLKLEATHKEGRGQLWKVPRYGLRNLPFSTDWEVVADFYDTP